MIVDLGTVTPGSTLRVTFDSYSGTDGSSITMTNFAVGDILIYKDGSTTERASTSGYTATTDFDSKTGKQFVAIDLADNTTAGFYAAGSEYLVAIDTVTIDGAATGGWLARFRIGYEGASLNTTIATLSSQTSFTLTNGPAEDDALNGRWAIIHDVASSVQCAWVQILDYTGSTKTVTLAAAGTFTAAATDNFSLMGPMPVQATVIGRTLDITATGAAGVDWGNVENQTTTVGLSGTTVKTATDVEADTQDIQSRVPAALVSGRMDSSVGAYQSGQAPLQPTTAGRTLDVSLTGEAGIDWANIGSPTTTVTLSGTTVKTATDVEADTQDIQSRIPTVLGANGNIKADVRDFNGTAGTFASGRPEVNSTHFAGTAYATALAAEVDAVLDEVVLGSYTMRQLLRGISAALIGKVSGAATSTVTIRSANDVKDVIVATVDANGNRSAITLDLT